MRFVKLGVISIIVFSVLVILLSLLFPSHVRISRAVNIRGSRDSILIPIADMRRWKEWNEMTKNSNLTQKNYTEKEFRSTELIVSQLSANTDSVVSEWKYKSSNTIQSGFNLVQSLTDTTVVQWYFDFHLNWYPWEKFSSIIFDQQLGPSMEKSLSELKNTIEASR